LFLLGDSYIDEYLNQFAVIKFNLKIQISSNRQYTITTQSLDFLPAKTFVVTLRIPDGVSYLILINKISPSLKYFTIAKTENLNISQSLYISSFSDSKNDPNLSGCHDSDHMISCSETHLFLSSCLFKEVQI